MGTSKTTVAVVGCGYWGPNLVRNLVSIEHCTAKTICDRDPERLGHLAALYPFLRTTQEPADVAGDPEVDAVLIATPVTTHFAIASMMLSAGKHVFVEKPMAATAADCRALLEIAEARGLRIMIGHTFLYSSAVRKIREIVDSGEVGEIRYVSSRRLNLGLLQKDINVAWDLAPHDLSIILYLTGKRPVLVSCQGMSHARPGLEDVTVMSLHFPGGTFAVVHSSWLDPRKIRETTIVGSKGMIVYDDNEPLEKIKVYDKAVQIPPHYDTYAEFHFSYHYGDMRAPYIKQHEPLRLECETFLRYVRGEEVCLSSGRDGLLVVEILEGANKSLKSGGAPVALGGAT